VRPARWLRFAIASHRGRFDVAVFLPLPVVLPVVAAFSERDPLRAHALFHTACFYLYTTQLANPGPAMYYMFEWLYATTALLALWCMGVRLLEARLARGRPAPRKRLQCITTICEELMSVGGNKSFCTTAVRGGRPAEDAALL
jgi:hypothetical protein